MNAQHTDSPAAAAMQPRHARHFSAAAAILAFAATAFPGSPADAQLQFQDATLAAGTVGNGESWGASWGDYNGDGWSDVFMSVHRGVPRLYRNNADGTFTDVAAEVDITERAVQRIVLDLEEAGVIHRHRQGRRNVYQVLTNQPLRHPVESHRTVGDLLELVNGSREPGGEPGGHEPGGGEAEPDAGGAG